MKRQKKKLAKCPCCKSEKHRSEIIVCLNKLEKWEKQTYAHRKELQLDAYNSFINADFSWACDDCLKKQLAIEAHLENQVTPWTPHTAYFDNELYCYTCKSPFLFTKKEKQTWYESYKLPINAEPNDCLKCRRESRQINAQNKVLSELLNKPQADLSADELQQIIRVYVEWGKMDKAKYYQAVLRTK